MHQQKNCMKLLRIGFTKLWKEHNSMPNNIKMVIRDLNAKPGSEDTYRGVIYQKQPASGNQQ